MFGTVTLRGVQRRNIFVTEDGQEYRIINCWIHPKSEVEKYVLLQKFDDNYWRIMREIILCRRDI